MHWLLNLENEAGSKSQRQMLPIYNRHDLLMELGYQPSVPYPLDVF